MPSKDLKIIVTPEVAAHVRAHGEEAWPCECCGFLYGREDEVRLITHALRATNSKAGDQRRRFEITPTDYLEAEQYAATHGLQLLGIYHSHPEHPAVASRHDLAQAMPFFSYLIVSVRQRQAAEMRSWRLRDTERAFDEEEIVISPAFAKN